MACNQLPGESMSKPKKLYKTTVVIWSEYDPSFKVEIDELARDAIQGESYCSTQNTEEITDPSQFPETEFFDTPE